MSEPVCECLTDGQLRAFKRAFEELDESKSGYIDAEGFKKALRKVGINPTNEEFTAMLQDIDNEKISLTDFVSVIYYFLRGADTKEELYRAFAVFDKDGFGTIPRDDVIQILTNLKHPISLEHAEPIVEKLAVDGMVKYTELIDALKPQ